MRAQIIETSCDRRGMEVQRIRNLFEMNGWEVNLDNWETDKTADCIILSTCGFTQAAEDFGLKTIKRVEEEKKDGCRIIIGGCIPKINPSSIEGYEHFDPRSYEALNDIMNFQVKLDQVAECHYYNKIQDREFVDIHTVYREQGITEPDINSLDEEGIKTRADNKKVISDITQTIHKDHLSFRVQCQLGCQCSCSYCAIRFAIGKLKSKPIKDILKEIETGMNEGYKIIRLDGDSLGCYGLDINSNIGVLLKEITGTIEGNGVKLHVRDISPKFLNLCYNELITLNQKNCLDTLFIPIQHGSQKIIDLMNRGYNIIETVNFIKLIQKNTDFKIGTSIILGFPGETEEDLEECIQVCRECKWDYIWCHSFSARNETKAASLPDKIPGDIALNRTRYFKSSLINHTKLITIPEDTKGNRTCQG